VPEQDCFDGRFPTVKSPNPEYGEALTMAINLAEKENADLVALLTRTAIAWEWRSNQGMAR
jgi:Phosphoglucomutase/phosphomannomutase, alpha/beta/alpha domain II.